MTLAVFSTLAVQGALPGLVASFEGETGVLVECTFAPSNGLLERLAAGERADVVILTQAALGELAAKGIVVPDSIADVAISEVGIAVQAGASKPDISTVDALKATLMAADSIAYSKIGASGVFFAGLIERLGIADAVNAKASIIPSGLTAELLASGEAEIAVQQMSELLLVRGIDVVGPLPSGAESVTMLSAGVLTSAAEAATGARFLQHLRSERAREALAASGLRAAP